MSEMQMKNRRCHIDLIKIVAIWLVIFNHTGERGFALFSLAWESDWKWLYLIVSIICKIAVPLFWMSSGALLLGKEEPLKVMLQKRFFRFACVLILFSMLQYLYSIRADMTAFSIPVFLTNLWTKGAGTTYWFLYAYLAYLLMLPFLRKIAALMKEKEYIYLIILQVSIVGIVPIIQEVVWRGAIDYYPAFSIGIVTGGNIVYLLIGYYLEKLPRERINRKCFFFLALISIVSIMISCYMIRIQYLHLGAWKVIVDNQEFLNCLVLVPTIAAYYGMRLLMNTFPLKGHAINICKKLGEAVFAVMLIENILRDWTEAAFIILQPYLKTMLSTFVWVSLTWLVGMIIGMLMKKIPYIKMLV